MPSDSLAATSAAPLRAGSVGASTTGSEKNATPPVASSGARPAQKLRSCLVCRNRKVRCDKLSPCSNCRRANIPCVLPATDRPPRWARRLERIVNNATSNSSSSQALEGATVAPDHVMERLKTLENLVKDLTSQLEQARSIAGSQGASPAVDPSAASLGRDLEPEHPPGSSPPVSTSSVQKDFGRLVLQDGDHSRYITSGFWSRVIDELNGLRADARSLSMDDSDSSGDETSAGATSSSQGLDRTPSERHAFFFGHNLLATTPKLSELHPLPSQIPFILSVYAENVNCVMKTLHMPTFNKMVRGLRSSDTSNLKPANEALLFSIYYAAIISMEDEEVVTNFGTTKAELSLKYRLGFEYALAKADFLGVPDLVLVQAFTIFLFLARRHDSPRFVWMLTGVVIRMAQTLGLQRDGSHFEHLTFYEAEMRRRIWWAVCMLDLRASEDQGTELTIPLNSFDTKVPLNINDADIDPTFTAAPVPHDGMTEMSMCVNFCETGVIMRRMTAIATKDGSSSDLAEQNRLLNEIHEINERDAVRLSADPENIANWVIIYVGRLVVAKMTLIIYLPQLFSTSGDHFPEEVKSKLFNAAIEVAEYNHALNDESAWHRWRWIYQTYTHWYAIVHMLLEISRRPWSPTVERAWVSLHSRWLIPSQPSKDKNLRVWMPLRKLMANAKMHRDAELERLRGDLRAASLLELEDSKLPQPSSLGPFPEGANAAELFRARWRQLLAIPDQPSDSAPRPGYLEEGTTMDAVYRSAAQAPITYNPSQVGLGQESQSNTGGLSFGDNLPDVTPSPWNPSATTYAPNQEALNSGEGLLYSSFANDPMDSSINQIMSPSFVPWLWNDISTPGNVLASADMNNLSMNMDSDSDMDWYNWLETAKDMEMDTGQSGGGQP